MSNKSNEQNLPELFFGLIAPIGTDLKRLRERLEIKLKKYDYRVEVIKISDFISALKPHPQGSNNSTYNRYMYLIKEGNSLRLEYEKKSFLAMLSISDIASKRNASNCSNSDKKKGVAYIISQFKTPEELEVFKQVYGAHFFSLAVITDEATRVRCLKNRIGLEPTPTDPPKSIEGMVGELFYEDNAKTIKVKCNTQPYEQNIGGTLDKADYFLDYKENVELLDNEVKRFLERIFYRPYKAPNSDEYCMSVAFNAALRSMDMGQQIGSCIASEDGEILSTGFNEVPTKGGGNYWENKDYDERDFARGEYSLATIKKEYENKLIARLSESMQNIGIDITQDIKEVFERDIPISLQPIIEFGKSTHAEMAALLEAARQGHSVAGKILYTTTYPCHLCCINIIAAGIKKVIYLKHYPKSRAIRMFPHIVEENFFKPFVGVSPRSYVKTYGFRYDSGLRDKNGDRLSWDDKESTIALKGLNNFNYELDEKIVGCYVSSLVKNQNAKIYGHFKESLTELFDFTEIAENTIKKLYEDKDQLKEKLDACDYIFS